jgi:amino acid transporter
VILLLNIGSTEVLGIMLSIFNSALLASYAITIGCILMHRLRGRPLPHARFSLGNWGVLVNVIALIYLLPIWVFSFFPAGPKPTPANMNWACVMVGGVVIFATVYYIIWGRKFYTPPNETTEDYIERYQATSASSEKVPNVLAEESVEGGRKME